MTAKAPPPADQETATAISRPTSRRCLSIVSPERLFAGSGFLVARGSALWVITAAHVPLGTPQFHNFDEWPETIQIRSKTENFSLMLFAPGTRRPMFRHLRDRSGLLHDMIAMAVTGYSMNADIYSWSEITTLPARAAGYGFPNSSIFPLDNPSVYNAGILPSRPECIITDVEITPGYSGGPLTDGAGKLIGMMFGSADDNRGLSHTIASMERLFIGP